MQQANLGEAAYREGSWGPAYVLQAPGSDIGVLLLRPGDAVPNHLHHHCDETFVVLEGRATLWIDCRDAHVLETEHVYRCEAGEMHHLVNDSDADFRCLFIKAPPSPGDTIVVPWTPGTPPPPPQ